MGKSEYQNRIFNEVDYMKKIQYTIYKRDTGNASGKAKKDCLEILERLGFTHLYKPSRVRVVRVVQQFVALLVLSMKKEEKIFAFQYPAVHERFYPLIIKAMHTHDITIVIIHDLLTLQNNLNEEKLQEEINFLNNFKYVVVPNESMLTLLKDNGCIASLVDMKIYDYLHNAAHPIVENAFSNTICFAGNLQKSIFLRLLKEIKDVDFLLYGKDGEYLIQSNTKYEGCLPADELVYFLKGDYGLVWDGDSLDECTGAIGKYLLYNSPHKLSSYVAAGKPVITWDKAAIAKYVKDHNIGIVISSLKNLENIDLEKDYYRYKRNVMILKKKLATGYYLEKAINTILKGEKK